MDSEEIKRQLIKLSKQEPDNMEIVEALDDPKLDDVGEAGEYKKSSFGRSMVKDLERNLGWLTSDRIKSYLNSYGDEDELTEKQRQKAALPHFNDEGKRPVDSIGADREYKDHKVGAAGNALDLSDNQIGELRPKDLGKANLVLENLLQSLDDPEFKKHKNHEGVVNKTKDQISKIKHQLNRYDSVYKTSAEEHEKDIRQERKENYKERSPIESKLREYFDLPREDSFGRSE